MSIVNSVDTNDIPRVRACDVLGVSRATLYRARTPKRSRPPRTRRPNPRRISDPERAAVLAALHSAEFVDQPPAEVFATLLSRGEYLASIRTMYRLLAAQGEVHERRRQRTPQRHAVPSLTATAPNQVWTWDITKLRGPEAGVFFALYVIIDLFSRMVVGWLLAAKESAELAKQLFAETCERHHVKPGSLVVHADRGAAMRSDGLAELFAKLGVDRSFSRPHVSDDNAFSEAQFKTLKYQPDYPDRFGSELHARAWSQEFFGWFNDSHHHSGLALFTPAEVFHGRVDAVLAVRQAALDAAFAEHPERFPNGRSIAKRPPTVVTINAAPSATDRPVEALPGAEVAAPAPGGCVDPASVLDGNDVGANATTSLARAPDDGAEPRGTTASKKSTRVRRAEVEQPQTRRGAAESRPVPS